MLTETNTSQPSVMANVDVQQAAKAAQAIVGSSKEAARNALLRPSFTPIYVEHKKKVPLTTFELNTAALNPLARRGLERLPRINGVPVIRAMGKEDGLGFSFVFRIDPTEMTVAALPSLLERWYEKYETAKAKAGLTPKPEKPPEPLVPRSPRRKMEILPGQELDAQAKGVEVIKVDMSVVDSAIKSFEAKAVTAVLASSHAQHTELPDPLSEGAFVDVPVGAYAGASGGELAGADQPQSNTKASGSSNNTRADYAHQPDSAQSSDESKQNNLSSHHFRPHHTKAKPAAKSKYEPLPYHYVVGSPDEDDDDESEDSHVESVSDDGQGAKEFVHVANALGHVASDHAVPQPEALVAGQSTPVASHDHAHDSDWPMDEDFPISYGHGHDYVPFEALDAVASQAPHAVPHIGNDEAPVVVASAVDLPVPSNEVQPSAAASLVQFAPLAMQLPAVRLKGFDQDITSQQWTDDQANVWTAWTTLSFSVTKQDESDEKSSPQIIATAHHLPLEHFESAMQDTLGDDLMPVATMGSNIQVATQQWLPMALSQLAESVEDTMKAARTPMTRRHEFLEQAVTELPLRLDSLQAMLVDLQLANDLARRVRKNILGMPEWATVVLTTLELSDHWHQSYLDAANFREAAAVLARWSQPLAELKLVNQLGLFGDPQTLRLLRQLGHIVEHAKKWSLPTGTRADCARVLAVWVDVVHHFTPECATEDAA